MKKVFKSSYNRAVPEAKAQEYGEYLLRLMKANDDRLTPGFVVEKARSQESPLHGYFEWDNKNAGDLWRLQQATSLLNHIEVEITTGEEEARTIRAFLNVKEDTNGKDSIYVLIDTVADNEDYQQQVIEKAFRELIGWKERYKTYKELGLIFGAIEETQKKLGFQK